MMRRTITALALAASTVTALFSAGCTQMPTEKQSISDLRPQIAFRAESDRARMARVLVDGMDVGSVSDYIEGVASVRLLPGTHKLHVVAGSDVLLDEKIYVGDGVNRTFNVK